MEKAGLKTEKNIVNLNLYPLTEKSDNAMKSRIYLPLVLLLPIVLLVSGCDQNQKSVNISQNIIKKYSEATTIGGTVSTGKSLIKTGTVDVNDENGQKIKQAAVENGHFQVEIPSGTNLPLLLNFSSESYLEKLVSVVIDENVTHYFIDPSTTAIAKAAKAIGGYTRANLVRAAEETIHTPDANKTTTGWRGDPTTQYGGWH